MKGKKFALAVLTVAMLGTACFSLAGCDLNGLFGGGKKDEEVQHPTSPDDLFDPEELKSDKLSEAEWNSAFAAKNFRNVNYAQSVKSPFDDVFYEGSYDGDKIRMNDGKEDYYLAAEDSAYFSYTKVDGRWTKTEIDEDEYEMSSYRTLAEEMSSSCSYEEFTYDAEVKGYTASTVVDEESGTTVEITVKFQNKKLASVSSENGTAYKSVWYFYDYGKAKVTLPSLDAEEPENPDKPVNPDNPDNPDTPDKPVEPDETVSEKLTKAEWKAATELSNFKNVTLKTTTKGPFLGQHYEMVAFENGNCYLEAGSDTMSHSYHSQENGKFYLYYEEDGKFYKKEIEQDEMEYWTPEGYLGDILDFLQEGEFTYNEKEEGYVYFDAAEGSAQTKCVAKFQNGKLVSITFSDGEGNQQTTVFYGYGTTKVTLPSKYVDYQPPVDNPPVDDPSVDNPGKPDKPSDDPSTDPAFKEPVNEAEWNAALEDKVFESSRCEQFEYNKDGIYISEENEYTILWFQGEMTKKDKEEILISSKGESYQKYKTEYYYVKDGKYYELKHDLHGNYYEVEISYSEYRENTFEAFSAELHEFLVYKYFTYDDKEGAYVGIKGDERVLVQFRDKSLYKIKFVNLDGSYEEWKFLYRGTDYKEDIEVPAPTPKEENDYEKVDEKGWERALSEENFADRVALQISAYDFKGDGSAVTSKDMFYKICGNMFSISDNNTGKSIYEKNENGEYYLYQYIFNKEGDWGITKTQITEKEYNTAKEELLIQFKLFPVEKLKGAYSDYEYSPITNAYYSEINENNSELRFEKGKIVFSTFYTHGELTHEDGYFFSYDAELSVPFENLMCETEWNAALSKEKFQNVLFVTNDETIHKEYLIDGNNFYVQTFEYKSDNSTVGEYYFVEEGKYSKYYIVNDTWKEKEITKAEYDAASPNAILDELLLFMTYDNFTTYNSGEAAHVCEKDGVVYYARFNDGILSSMSLYRDGKSIGDYFFESYGEIKVGKPFIADETPSVE